MPIFDLSNRNDIVDKIGESDATLVVFWRPGCGPCEMFKPVVEQIANEYADVTIIRYNVEQDSEFADESNVNSTPTTFFYNNGELFEKKESYFTLREFEKILEKHS